MQTNLHQAIVSTLAEGHRQLCDQMRIKFGLGFGMPEVMLAEYAIYAMRPLAPMELDSWLDVITKEMRTGLPPNATVINEARSELVDILNLNART